MAWMTKGSRAYEIRSVRRGHKVTSEYVGGGSISAESAFFFRQLEAGRRSQRAAERAEWEAERVQLADVEREFIEADAAYVELAEAALYATGHHRPRRGRWRKRRTMANKIGDGTVSESALRASANRSLAHTEQGREILKRRGFSSTEIERMQRPS